MKNYEKMLDERDRVVPFEYVVDKVTFHKLIKDDRLFDCPYVELVDMLVTWTKKYTRTKGIDGYCIVVGCPSKAIRVKEATANLFCDEHNRVHRKNITRLYKNAEESIARIMDGIVRSYSGLFNEDKEARGAWVSEKELDQEKSYQKDSLLFTKYIKMMTRTLVKSKPRVYDYYRAEKVVEKLVIPHIRVLLSKALFYRKINDLVLGPDKNHIMLTNNYENMLLNNPGNGEDAEKELKRDLLVLKEEEPSTFYGPSVPEIKSKKEHRHKSGSSEKERKRERKPTSTESRSNEDKKRSKYDLIGSEFCSHCEEKEAMYRDEVSDKLYCSYECRHIESESEDN